MAASILKNSGNGSVILHATSNATFIIAGNNSVSNVATNNEIVSLATIKQVWSGSSSGNGAYWVLKRGANVVGVYDSTFWKDYAGNGFALNKDSSANVVVELHNAASDEGYIMIEIKKEIAGSL